MNDFSKVALVTGATGGIGQSIAERLSDDGFIVFVHYSGNKSKAEEVVHGIQDKGGKAFVVHADVTNVIQVREMFAKTKTINGKLDVLVHSAGIMPMAKINPEGIEETQRVINTNLIGSVIVLSHAADAIEGGGRIIALSSSVVAKNFPNYGGYIASKLGVEGLVRVMANELGIRNINVNAVAPGPTGTALFYKDKTQEQIDFFKRASPLGRIGTPEDISSAVSMLAGEEGAWINGQIVRVNGGFA
ncbi:SDR family oxidoreductase [Pantoea sp. Al-1710]|uniref:SDR family oxidoreductase n=1 Tax=Candidatus Pantoea communis TaxID=2608354 RepID=A0ABX0RIB8_9GAMM|nr:MULTISPECIES: SDR family oxidoreductase [Pantoea]NIG12909.1 SDR family oxidoreductase [Pantoea sp. Cy-640]NIG17390.1 SDR family oxidoreductase [Pantoea communis]